LAGTLTARVALVCAAPATIVADYARLLALVGLGALRSPDMVIALHRRMPFPGASAPPWQSAGVARALLAHHVLPRFILSQPDPDDLHGHAAVARRLAALSGGLGPGITEQAVDALEKQDLVLLAPLRRGPAGPFSGALGCLAQAPEHALTALAQRRSRGLATLAVLDGTTVGNGPPGAATHPELGNLLIASADPVAADAVAATLLGIDPLHDLAHLRQAQVNALGVADIASIEVLGDPELLAHRWPALPTTPAVLLRARFERHSSWTKRERDRYTSWIYDTGWGQLFAAYQRKGTSEEHADLPDL
jgi:hypothetical protein